MTPYRLQSRGFSLIELMVAMVIGVVLLGGLVLLMANSKKNYAQQDYSARLQENARFAMEFLSYDIRMAGYFGCSNEINNDSTVVPVVVPDSDPNQITVMYGESYDPGSEVTVDASSYDPYGTPNTLPLNRIPDDWSGDDLVIIVDCGSASVATINTDGIDTDDVEITVTPKNGGFGRVYDQASNDNGPVVVRRLISNTYAVEASGESGVPVLTRNGEEIVEGVEDIRLLYQSATGAGFATGDSSTQTPLAVKLGALVRSISNDNLDPDENPNREYGSGDELTVDDGDYQLLNQTVAAGALRGQRRVFTTTLSVRNRRL